MELTNQNRPVTHTHTQAGRQTDGQADTRQISCKQFILVALHLSAPGLSLMPGPSGIRIPHRFTRTALANSLKSETERLCGLQLNHSWGGLQVRLCNEEGGEPLSVLGQHALPGGVGFSVSLVSFEYHSGGTRLSRECAWI